MPRSCGTVEDGEVEEPLRKTDVEESLEAVEQYGTGEEYNDERLLSNRRIDGQSRSLSGQYQHESDERPLSV